MSDTTVAPKEQQLFRAKPKALEIMASRLSVEPAKMLETLKATVFKNATNEEMMALVVVANEYELNPFLKELYAFPAKGGGIVPVVSVDGWIKMLNRQAGFDGIEFEFADGDKGKPVSCTAIIYIKGRSRPVKIVEYFDECSRNTDPWNKSPRRMLRHKALIQGARVAFGFSGVQDEDEARSSGEIDEVRIASARPVFSTAHSLPARAVGAEPSPEPEPEPEQQPASDDAPDETVPDDQLPDAILALMRSNSVTDSELCAWAKGAKLMKPEQNTITELSSSKLRKIVEGWSTVQAAVFKSRAVDKSWEGADQE